MASFMEVRNSLKCKRRDVGSHTGVAQVGFFVMSGERQIKRIREEYFRALMRQDISWFDTNKPGEVASRMTEQTITVQAGIGEAVGNCIHHMTTFFAGIIIGEWDAYILHAAPPHLTLVVFAQASSKAGS